MIFIMHLRYYTYNWSDVHYTVSPFSLSTKYCNENASPQERDEIECFGFGRTPNHHEVNRSLLLANK